MSNIVIQVEDLSKQYRLGVFGARSLTEDANRWWAKLRGKEDPYLKIGDENKRDTAGDSDYVWALRDVNFEVKEGQVLGIIGRNGAGKSTLLKILSKVTGPTTGVVRTKGRTASLLEVGTGFHPELTGRENVFLNGAILGMTRKEVQRKFDEIVDFSGVKRYVDTPVKRYSSGMKVRLGFAVAAHLEPEILIVDEVLAVGDVEFQKKCMGKMKDVAGHGRTILFVSHNLNSIKKLCTSAMMMRDGRIAMIGDTNDVVDTYTDTFSEILGENTVGIMDFERNGAIAWVTQVRMLNDKKQPSIRFFADETIHFEVYYTVEDPNAKLGIAVQICQIPTELRVMTVEDITYDEDLRKGRGKGSYRMSFSIAPHILNEGKFYFRLFVSTSRGAREADSIAGFGFDILAKEDLPTSFFMYRQKGVTDPPIKAITEKL